ncbi:MAG: lytic transglycosylase domain-containing protein [Burkholderiales bacterium]
MLCNGLAHADIYRAVDADSHVVFTDVRPTTGRYEVIYRQPVATPKLAEQATNAHRFDAGSAAPYAHHIQAAAVANNLDPALIRAVITAESGYNPRAVSRTGAVGLMQLMPETASRYNVTNSRDPEQNIHGGARYLRDLLQMFNQDVRLAVAAYNAGEQAVMKYGNRIPPYRETIAYVPKVLHFYDRYRKGLAPTATPNYQRAASTRAINYRRVASSGTGMVSYQRAATPAAVGFQRAALTVKKNGARTRGGVIYLSNAP